MKLWILIIENEQGRTVKGFNSKEQAEQFLDTYAYQNWDFIDDLPSDKSRLIGQYFQLAKKYGESYTLTECELEE